MEQAELIKFISEFGILVVIAGLYLYERFMSDRDSSKLLGDLKILLEKLNEKECAKARANLTVHELRAALDLYLSSQKCELIAECDAIVTINHINDNPEVTKKRIKSMVRRVHARHKDFIDRFTYEGKELGAMLDSQDFINMKAQICEEWIFGDDHHPLPLSRRLDSYFETFSLELE